MSSINTQAGSFYPEKSILEYQLKPHKGEKSFIPRNEGEVQVRVWSRAFTDLNRLGTLQVNGKSIYQDQIPKNKLNQNELKRNRQAAEVHFVFSQLESELKSTSLAVNASHLLEQNLKGEILKQILLRKKISWLVNDNDIGSSHAPIGKMLFSQITTTDKTFKLVNEELIQLRPNDDPEHNITFFKIKTEIRGSLDDLRLGASHKMTIQTAYTQEHSDLNAAIHDDYRSSKTAAGFSTESFLRSTKNGPKAASKPTWFQRIASKFKREKTVSAQLPPPRPFVHTNEPPVPRGITNVVMLEPKKPPLLKRAFSKVGSWFTTRKSSSASSAEN